MRVTDWKRQDQLDGLRWKVLVASASMIAAIMEHRYMANYPPGIRETTGQDVNDALDAAVCAYAAKLIEPIKCKACGQVIKPEDKIERPGRDRGQWFEYHEECAAGMTIADILHGGTA